MNLHKVVVSASLMLFIGALGDAQGSLCHLALRRYIVGRGYNAATGRDEAFLLDTERRR